MANPNIKSIAPLAFCLFLTSWSLAQFERADVINNKIRSVTTRYLVSDTGPRLETRKVYTDRGNDSLQYDDGDLSFRYVSIMGANGNLERLERYDTQDRLDELHIFHYGKDGAYSIEVVAHGAGTILRSWYDKRHRCLKQEFSGVETIHYVYDDAGRLVSLLYNKEKEEPEKIATVVYGKDGRIEKISSTVDDAAEYFKYNAAGLVSERTTVRKNAGYKELRKTIFFEYSFR